MGQQRPLVAATSECSTMAPMFSAVLSLPGLSLDLHSPYSQLSTLFSFLEWFRVCILEPHHRKPSPREETDSCLTDCHTRGVIRSAVPGFTGQFLPLSCPYRVFPPLCSTAGQLHTPAHKCHSELYYVGDIHHFSFCSQMRGTTIMLRHKRGRVGCRHSWVACLSCPRFPITPFSYSGMAFFGLWTRGSQIWPRYPQLRKRVGQVRSVS